MVCRKIETYGRLELDMHIYILNFSRFLSDVCAVIANFCRLNFLRDCLDSVCHFILHGKQQEKKLNQLQRYQNA